MSELETQLRQELARRVAEPPALPGLPAQVLHRGRRARRRRAVAGAAALAVVLVGAALAGLPGPARPQQVAALQGPPSVPLFTAQAPQTLYLADGREEPLGDRLPLAALPAGLLVLDGEELLLRDPASTDRVLALGVQAPWLALRSDRVTVVAQDALVELAVPSGETLHVLPLDDLGLRPGEVVPTAYEGDAVLLTVGEGERQRAVRWEPEVAAALVPVADGLRRVHGAAGGQAAYATDDDERCPTVVRPAGWRLCREPFVAFSPRGTRVLATNAVSDGLVVRDADDGRLVRRFDVPRYLRASGWESEDVVVLTTVDDDGEGTLVRRCSVRSGACATSLRFPWSDRVPQPVPLAPR